ncbi:S24 family peptidase [Chromohalobacter sp. 296-RDG]|uniref:S24 family peptidase n=1 Tax=Chromohalobacter sp. 296-RDG TaxID=2994062 RepID=UPI002469282C|nr:S24 family peptidase [Chromohalobacter sp. 296-RDG]
MHKCQREMHLRYAPSAAIIAFMQKDRSKDVLKRLIAVSGKRATEVARDSGVPQSTLSRILGGKIESPRDAPIAALASYFGISSEKVRGRAPLSDGDFERLMGGKRRSPSSSGDELELLDTEIIEDAAPLSPDEVMLPIFREVEFSAGDGRTQVIENHGAQERFSLSKLSKKGVQPENAALAVAAGDSMETTILDGATLGIDKGSQHITDGKIYALDHGGMLRIKRLYRLPVGRIRVVSDNSHDYPEEVYHMNSDDAPRVIGRVFWWENFD